MINLVQKKEQIWVPHVSIQSFLNPFSFLVTQFSETICFPLPFWHFFRSPFVEPFSFSSFWTHIYILVTIFQIDTIVKTFDACINKQRKWFQELFKNLQTLEN